MAGRIPKAGKPREELRRRNRPEEWTVLPAEGCALAAPAWPTAKPSKPEADLWARLWRLPVAAWWHEQSVEPFVVARYVRLALERPEHATVSRLEGELGLTPAALLRLRLVVEHPEPEAAGEPDHYEHLRRKAKP
jgi:hypothetical protein